MTPFKKGLFGWLIVCPAIAGFAAAVSGYSWASGAIWGVYLGSGYYAMVMSVPNKKSVSNGT